METRLQFCGRGIPKASPWSLRVTKRGQCQLQKQVISKIIRPIRASFVPSLMQLL